MQNLSLFTGSLSGCILDDCIQQLYLLFGRTVQFFDGLIDQACVDIGDPLCQLTLSCFRFRVMDNQMDWSTCSADTTHLPR